MSKFSKWIAFCQNEYFIVALSLAISLKLFFSAANIPWSFTRDSAEWYVNYSKEIFHPNYFLKSAYYTESLLLPLIANSFGAAKSLEAYKVFCALITVLILPIWGFIYFRNSRNFLKTILFITLLSISFQYFHDFVLGFPDPLTILLLGLIPFQNKQKWMVIFTILASLSHYSLAVLSIFCYGMLLLASSSLNVKDKIRITFTLLISLAIGKIILLLWNFIFDYHPLSRIQWAIDNGFEMFYKNYQSKGLSFWLIPSKSFLLIYFSASLIFLKNRPKFFFCALAVLAISYSALFFTLDGYRIFAVIICTPYLFVLSQSIDQLFNSIHFYKNDDQKLPKNLRV